MRENVPKLEKSLFCPIPLQSGKSHHDEKVLSQTYKAVSKPLRLMSSNLRHPSLATHEFHSKQGPNGEKILECYAQNHNPAAHRIFWYYGPGKKVITVIAITPHP